MVHESEDDNDDDDDDSEDQAQVQVAAAVQYRTAALDRLPAGRSNARV